MQNGLGPSPVRSGASGLVLSVQRAAVLEYLQHRREPALISDVATDLSLHPNTVREHLEALVDRGLIERFTRAPSGRGRPASFYQPVARMHEIDPRILDYSGLVGALSTQIRESVPDPVEYSLAAGEAWGRRIAAEPHQEAGRANTDGRGTLVDALEQLGFAPEVQDSARPGAGSTIRLRRCPLLDAAVENPDIVCNIHLGMARGLLMSEGEDPDALALHPFAEAGACVLMRSPTDAAVGTAGPA